MVLAELPSADEFTDNIVAFWRPAAPLTAGSELRYAYRLSFGEAQPDAAPLARVIGTRSGLSILDGRERVFVVDFDLGMIDFTTLDAAARGQRRRGRRRLSMQRLPDGNLARVAFHFVAGERAQAEFRLWLDSHGQEASEILALPLERVRPLAIRR